MEIAVLILSILLIILGVLFIVSRLVYRRSIMATLVEWFLKLTEKRYTYAQFCDFLSSGKGNERIKIPFCRQSITKNNIKETSYDGMQVFSFNTDRQGRDAAIIYLHGGAYVRKPRVWHFRFVKRLAKKTGLDVIMPIYPKAPEYDCDCVSKLLINFYTDLSKSYGRIILMGDSSGGGLALSISLQLIKRQIRQPERLILLSPWPDVSMSNPAIADYERKDPIVFVDNVKIAGEKWAGSKSVTDPTVSPLYASFNHLNPVDVFCGTREVLYPDNEQLCKCMRRDGVEVKFHVAEGMNHVYPIFPICEARRAFADIVDIINNSVGK